MSWSMIENYAESGTVYILADIGYDISTLPTNFPSGTICYVMDDSAKYRLSPSGVWAQVELDYVPEVYPDQECEHPTYYVISKNNAVSKEVLIESESDLEDVPRLVGILYRLSDGSASYKYSPAGNYFVKMAKKAAGAAGMQFYKVTFDDSTDKFIGPDGSELNFAALADKYNDNAYFLFCEYQSVTYIPSLPPVEDPIHPDRVLEFVATWVYGGDVNVSRLAINENEQIKNETFVVGGGGSAGGNFIISMSYSEEGTLFVDKTLSEIRAAYDQGKNLVVYDDAESGCILQLQYIAGDGSSVYSSSILEDGLVIFRQVEIDEDGISGSIRCRYSQENIQIIRYE